MTSFKWTSHLSEPLRKFQHDENMAPLSIPMPPPPPPLILFVLLQWFRIISHETCHTLTSAAITDSKANFCGKDTCSGVYKFSYKFVVFLPICLHKYLFVVPRALKSKSNKDAIHLIGEKDRVMIGMRVYIISIEVGGGGSGSGPLLSFIESPKSLLLPPSPLSNGSIMGLQWQQEQWRRGKISGVPNFQYSLVKKSLGSVKLKDISEQIWS